MSWRGPSTVRILCVFFISKVSAQTGPKLVCFGDEFVTQLTSNLLELNRENLARNEPNTLGNHRENLGLFVMYNPRSYNLSKSIVHGLIKVDCKSREDVAIIRIPLGTPGFVVVYDYIVPGYLATGKVVVSSDYLGMIYTLESPLEARSSRQTMLTNLEVYRSDDFKLSFTGIYPVTRLLSSVFWLSYRVVPSAPLELFKALTLRTLQTYLRDNPIPL